LELRNTLYNGYFALAYPLGSLGSLGLNADIFNSNSYSEKVFHFSYGKSFFRSKFLACGVNFKYLLYGFDFSSLDDYDRINVINDPFWNKYGKSKSLWSFDGGILFKKGQNLNFVFTGYNILAPNKALNPDDTDELARLIRCGTSYKHPFLTGALDLEVKLRKQYDNKYPIRLFMGAEKNFFNKKLYVRGGVKDYISQEILPNEIDFGFSFEFLRRKWEEPGVDYMDGKEFTYIKSIFVLFEYAVAYPFGTFHSVYGNHNMGLKVLFDKTKLYQRYITKKDLEDSLRKRKEEVTLEIVENMKKKELDFVESEKEKIKAKLEADMELEKKNLEEEMKRQVEREIEKRELESKLKYLGKEEKLEEQIRDLEEVIREKEVLIQRSTNTNEAITHLVDAVKYFFEGNYNQAENECLISIDIAPYLALSYTRLGSIYLKQGRLQEAIASWEKTLELEPDNKEVNEWLMILKGNR
jgi:tetratricopeptide (TPR) repeat protein